MCIKLRRPLNPKAEEWRPTAQSSPLQPQQLVAQVIFPSHSQPPAAPLPPPQVAAYTGTPPQELLSQPPHHQPCYYSHRLPSYQALVPYNVYALREQPFYYASFPADEHFYKAAEAEKSSSGSEIKELGCGNDMNIHGENIQRSTENKVEGRRGGIPKSPSLVVFKKGSRMVFPPRLRRAVKSFSVEKKPPVKKEWRPRKSAKPDCEVSGDGGASHSLPSVLPIPPPPTSGDDFSHSSCTTVMIKNIPNQLRRDFMLKFLDKYSIEHSLEYDFLYVPMDFKTKDNLGYAFVNFTSGAAALKFKNVLNNFKWGMVCTDRGPVNSKKICQISWARIQGQEALVKRFQNSCFSCDKLDFLPVVLDPPRNGADPNPSPPVILGSLHRGR